MGVEVKDLLMSAMIILVVTVLAKVVMYGLKNFQVLANRWLEQKKEEAQQRDDDLALKLFCTMQQMVNSIVYNAVAAMEQTTAADLRERVKKGLADRSELEKLATDVLNGVRAQLEPDVEAILSMYITDMDAYLKNQIESSLSDIKNMRPVIPEVKVWEPGTILGDAGSGTEDLDDSEICLE